MGWAAYKQKPLGNKYNTKETMMLGQLNQTTPRPQQPSLNVQKKAPKNQSSYHQPHHLKDTVNNA